MTRKWKWVRRGDSWEAARGLVALRVEQHHTTKMWIASASLPERDHWTYIGERRRRSEAWVKAEKAVPSLLRQSYANIVAELEVHGVDIPTRKGR